MNLTRTNWPLGWLPTNDAVNGNPEGLLRMDNLRIDKNGVVGLIDGMQSIGTTSDYVSAMYSKMISGKEYIWSAVGNPPTAISRAAGFSAGTSVVVGSSPTEKACFGDALGFVLTCAGKMRSKDPGPQGTVKPLGLLTPNNIDTLGFGRTGPLCEPNSQLNITLPCPTFINVGTGTSPSLTLDTEFFTGSMCTQTNFDTDTIVIGGGAAANVGEDTISFPFTIVDKEAAVIDRVVCDFILDGTPSDPSTYLNYYEMNFTGADIQSGINTQTSLTMKRADLVRFGDDQTKTWYNVIGVRFMVVATEDATVKFGDIKFTGGQYGQLNGVYNYIQVDVCNTGTYLAKSPASDPGWVSSNFGNDITVINGSVTIRPVRNDINTTDHWIFRKSASDLGIDPSTGLSLNTSSLNQYYYVGQVPRGSIFVDTLSDEEVLQLNADGSLLPNLYLQTLNTADPTDAMSDDIFAIEGIYRERVLYMTASVVYLSDRLNPDAIDTRYTLKPSGDPGEKNLWLKKLTNNTLILATTKDLYEISGTLLDLPDGTVDVTLIPIGEATPPLSVDCCKYDNGIYYIAGDGLRVTTGSNSANVSPQLRHFFQNSVVVAAARTTAVHGVPTVAIYNGVGVNYSIAAAHNRIYFVVPLQDGTRRVFVFDLVTKTYSLLFTDPVKLYTTVAGEVVASYGNPSYSIYLLDSIPGYGVGGEPILPFKFRTVFDANQQPRNRKDTFTLKLTLDTGGRNVSVDIQKNGTGVSEIDEPTWTNLGYVSANGPQTVYLSLSAAAITLGFRYALQLSDVSGVSTFKLYEATIEYEPRPEQLNYLRILPTNLGTITRKRWTAFAFVIDTLGATVSFTPYIDNVAWGTAASISTGTKLTQVFYFETEAIGTDIGGIFTSSSGVFEFYGVNLEECVSEKLPSPTKFLIIPPNNYGTPNRKRHSSYKFQINTRGSNVTFTPIVDGSSYSTSTINTSSKQTVAHYFPQVPGDVVGVDIGGTLSGSSPFEFYGAVIPQTIETLPDRLDFLRIPNSNFGLAARKRIRTISLILDTRGAAVTFTPYVDGVATLPATSFNTTTRQTVYHYFLSDVIGVDFGGILQGGSVTPFEFYGFGTPENVEAMPLPSEYYVIPPENYGTPNRKRHTSIKFQINTRGYTTVFKPIIDGVEYAQAIYNTTTKQTVEYFFPAGDVIGIDIGGTILGSGPFEFYGIVTPQTVEVLPDRLKYFRIPNSNFGAAARKRIRTLPMVIDTRGSDVTFTPIVDGSSYPTTTLNTNAKSTTYHYFSSDIFGTDFGGILSGSSAFEFYGLGTPEDVEVLPVPKLYDQIGPTRFDKIGKLFGFRLRIIPTGSTTTIPYQIWGDNSQSVPNLNYPLYSGSISVTPGYDNVYEVQLPKSINTDIVRITIGPTSDPFHRYDLAIKVQTSGMQGQSKWLPIR